jgi:gamma-glutamylcyclotransferase (GGCT)/AIG2-like uncharacterized protein YtfP
VSAVDGDPLERLRALCLALPQVTERLSHGEPTWFAGGRKVFVTFADHHHDDRLGFWCAAPPGSQIELVTSDPQRFFVPPYVGGRGWIGVRLDVGDVDWTELAEVVDDAYRTVATKRLVAELDRRRLTHLFVYGTLMPGRLRWPLLAPFATAHRPTEAVGTLYDSGNGWPVAVFGEDGRIPGFVVELEAAQIEEALPAIDEVEDTATDLLRRIEITTVDGTPAWAYHYPHGIDGLGRIERWADQVDR